MYCRKCGTKLNDDDAFCAGCGTKIVSAQQPYEQTQQIPRQQVQSPYAQQRHQQNVMEKQKYIKTFEKATSMVVAQAVSIVISIIGIIYFRGLAEDLSWSQRNLEGIVHFMVILACISLVVEAGLIAYYLSRKIVLYSNGLEIQKGTAMKIFVPFEKMEDCAIASSIMFGKTIAVRDKISLHKIPVGHPDEAIMSIEDTKMRYFKNK